MPRAPISKSKGIFVKPAAGPVPIIRELWGARMPRGHGGLSGEEGVGAEHSSPRLWVPRDSLKDTVSEFSSRNSKSLQKRFQTCGQQAGRAAIFRYNLGVLKLCPSTLLPTSGPACQTHVPGPLHKPSEAES